MSGANSAPPAMTKLLRTIRLDASDTFVYERAAAPAEWAVAGGFMFWDRDPSELTGRDRQAFRAGFLGLTSFGWSTLAVVVEAAADERAQAVASLARHLQTAHGAPNEAAAQAAAEEELAFAEQLAQHPAQTLVALHRSVRADGSVSEQFRTFHAADARQGSQMPCSAGAFAIIEEAEAAGVGAKSPATRSTSPRSPSNGQRPPSHERNREHGSVGLERSSSPRSRRAWPARHHGCVLEGLSGAP